MLLARWPKCIYVDHGPGPVLQPKVGGKLTSPVPIAASSTITKSADDGDLLEEAPSKFHSNFQAVKMLLNCHPGPSGPKNVVGLLELIRMNRGLSQQRRARPRPPLSRGLAYGLESVLADAPGAAAPGPVEPVMEDGVAVHGIPVAADEVELVSAVREAALSTAKSCHLLGLLVILALAL